LSNLDWIPAGLRHPLPDVRAHTRDLVSAAFPTSVPADLLDAFRASLAETDHLLETLEFLCTFPDVTGDIDTKLILISRLLLTHVAEHREVYCITKSFPRAPFNRWRDDLAAVVSCAAVSNEQIMYAVLFFLASRSTDSDASQALFDLIPRLAPSAVPDVIAFAAAELPAEFPSILMVITLFFRPPENLVLVLTCIINAHHPEWAVFVAMCITAAIGARLALLHADAAVMRSIVKLAIPIAKRPVSIPARQYERLTAWLKDQFLAIPESLRFGPPAHQVALLKLIRYLAYVLTPVLTESLGMLRGKVLAWMCAALTNPRARREFAKLTTECVREALACPGLTGQNMLRKRVDTWVGVYSVALGSFVRFIEVEPHLQFAMALSGCRSERYPTGSFWFAILNRLLDWDRSAFLEDYFRTILGNGVQLVDKGGIVQFVNELKEDDALVGKLAVLRVIVVMLKGNEVLREALAETYETLGELLSGVEGDDSLFDAVLEAMTDPD
jgi:hypothetical protein